MSARIVAMGLIEAIDRADPTRSHEMKPSARMSARRREWLVIRTIALSVIASAAIVASAILINSG